MLAAVGVAGDLVGREAVVVEAKEHHFAHVAKRQRAEAKREAADHRRLEVLDRSPSDLHRQESRREDEVLGYVGISSGF